MIDPRRCEMTFYKVVEDPEEATILDRLYLKACTEYKVEGKLDSYRDYLWAEAISRNKNFFTAVLFGLGAYALWWAVDLAGHVSQTLWGTLALLTALGLVVFSVIAMFGGLAVRYLDRPIKELKKYMPENMWFGWVGGSPAVLYLYKLEKRDKF